MKAITLFCLPFAGGNQYSFRELKNSLPGHIDLVPLDYPGRGSRMREALINSIEGMTGDMYRQLDGRLDGPYAIYGHSMGAAIGYELTHRIRENGLPMPLHLFVSGRNAPSSERRREVISNLPPAAFRAKIKELGGSPDEVLSNEALMELFEPILRNDFHAHENYVYNPQREKLNLPLSAMYGDREDLLDEDVEAWKEETSGAFSLTKYSGDHFFIFSHWKEIANHITHHLPG
jgi:surfactin synthase thioesterase subunit